MKKKRMLNMFRELMASGDVEIDVDAQYREPFVTNISRYGKKQLALIELDDDRPLVDGVIENAQHFIEDILFMELSGNYGDAAILNAVSRFAIDVAEQIDQDGIHSYCDSRELIELLKEHPNYERLSM